jgi:putative Ca2+/H+ antiporter (TMEM165/GDT1 family)
MDLGVALTVFALILPAELPDKTFVATLVLSTRYDAVPVLIGAAAGFAVQSAIAVAIGGAVSLLPSAVVHGVSAAIFALGAVLMLRAESEPAEDEREVREELAGRPVAPRPLRVVLTAFLVLFVAEWGDLTQILTASLSAKYDDPLAVFLGSWLALVAVAALAVTGGKALLRVLPLNWVRRIAAVAFAAVAVVTALEAAKVF